MGALRWGGMGWSWMRLGGMGWGGMGWAGMGWPGMGWGGCERIETSRKVARHDGQAWDGHEGNLRC